VELEEYRFTYKSVGSTLLHWMLQDARYQLSEPIAGGAMGDVWRATDTLLGRQTAIKLLKGGFGADESFLERFRREAKSAASLSHPAIATVYDYGEEQGKGRPAYGIHCHGARRWRVAQPYAPSERPTEPK
jgi:serine/threonine protein kinase